MIDTVRANHLPFAELPIDAKVMFYIQSMSAMEYHCNQPQTAAEIYHDLERIWNAEKLPLEDLRDWQRLSKLLKTQLSQCLSHERS
jgi:ribonucleotide reductase beta subunit family protein with ferritin-like domain